MSLEKEEKETFEVLVIGAGQSGLALGYFLKKAGIKFLILDENSEAGAVWRGRYDSLKLFTNNRHNSLPGLKFPGQPNKFPTKDEVANYFSEYARHFDLPIEFDAKVERVNKIQKNSLGQAGDFVVATRRGQNFQAKNVVVCTGFAHIPRVPEFSKYASGEILQLHSSQYKNPDQLRPGPVLVVGGGDSGVQIAHELARQGLREGRKVYFSFHGPLKMIRNNAFSVWIANTLVPILALSYKSFLLDVVTKIRKKYVFGNKDFFKNPNLIPVGEIKEIMDEEIYFIEKPADLKNYGRPEVATLEDVKNIIWATGFKHDFSWLDVPGLNFDEKNYPDHERGVTKIPGLYFLGFSVWHWKHGTFIGAVKRDAKYLSGVITKNRQKKTPSEEGVESSTVARSYLN